MTTTSAGDSEARGVFLDTNILVGLYAFWDAIRGTGKELGDVSRWADVKAVLSDTRAMELNLSSNDAFEAERGITAFATLRGGVGFYHYYSSQVCWSEMHHVLLERHGLEGLIRLGVPFSLRQQRPQRLYGRALTREDYARIKTDVDEFRASLRLDYSISLVDVEDTGMSTAASASSIWHTAEEVWSRVSMAVIDAYIYAAAIEVGADEFMTTDGPLREAIARLHAAEGDWAPLVESLKGAIGFETDERLPLPITQSTPLRKRNRG